MKRVLLTAVLLSAFAAVATADIQEPPGADQGPTRKLCRGIANLTLGFAEVPYQIASINDSEGNSAAFSYGTGRGIGRMVRRVRYGLYDVLLFPFPTYKGKYVAPYRLDNRWPSGGMSEFPPELGWKSGRGYTQQSQ